VSVFKALIQREYPRVVWLVSCHGGSPRSQVTPTTGRKGPRGFRVGTIRVVGRQPHAPAAFTPRGIPWYSFLEAESTPRHMVPSVATEKIPSVKPPGIDPETVWLIAQWLNHYATPGPLDGSPSAISNWEKKAIPLQAWTGPECTRRVRLSDFKTIGTRKW
jgi:hypothetical protein